jgi:hypothetical protein
MSQKPRKTRKMTAADTLITRAELQFFANAVDARIAQEIAKLTEKFTDHPLLISKDVDLTKFQVMDIPEQPPTDSEGAE